MKRPSFRSVPSGEHRVRFLFCEESGGSSEFGPAVRWVFEVLAGPDKGLRVSALTGRKFSQSTAAGKLLSQLLGCPLSSGRVDLRDIEGQRFQAVVVSAGAGAKVAEVRPIEVLTADEIEDSAGEVPF
jgi:hypothetical protein